MKRFFQIFLVLSLCQSLSSQNEYTYSGKVYFSEQIASNYNAYKYKIGKAKASKNYHKVARLYNEFIDHKLIGSYLDDFNIDCFNRKKNSIGDFEKPLVLMTYADWCIPLEDEVQTFNEHVKKSGKKIDFLVLIWGDKKEAKRLSKPFHKKVEILYVNELRNRDEHTVRMLKHALGVPTLIIADKHKKITDIIKVSPAFPNLFEHDFKNKLGQGIDDLDIN